MPAQPDATQNTPLAPSVEKAYYRKCIELKRRLNEVEEANDAARLRKLRLNRAIMKMRLERAFLLEQLAKRLEHAGSDQQPQSPSATQDTQQQQQQQNTPTHAILARTNPPGHHIQPDLRPPPQPWPRRSFVVPYPGAQDTRARARTTPYGPAAYPATRAPNIPPPPPPNPRQGFGGS